MKVYASVRLDVRKTETLRNGTDIVGNRTRVKVVKNKVAPPFKEAEFDIIYGEGISKEGCLIDLAVALDIINKSGAWFSYKGQRVGQGKDNVRLFLKANKEMSNEIEVRIREAYAKNTTGVAAPVNTSGGDEDDILGLEGN